MTAKPATAVAPRAASPTDPESIIAEMVSMAKTPQEKERLFSLADSIAQSKAMRRVQQLVANTEWGGTWSASKQIAFSRYCLALGADPLRHVDLLGGNPFINGDYFRDVIAASPHFDHADDPIWIHDDPRLQQCVACGKPFDGNPDHGHGIESVARANGDRLAERINRAALRVEHNGDEKSPSICILVLHYNDGRGPFRGIGEVHSGTTSSGKDRDPIGQQSPRATAETRAWRECGEKAEATWFRTHASTIDALATRVKDAHAGEKLGSQEQERGPVGLPSGEAEAIEVEAIPHGEAVEIQARTEVDVSANMVQHNPNGICGIEGKHLAADCKLEKK